MSWLIRVRPEAELDVVAAAIWYESQRPGLGAEFAAEIARAIASLSSSPLRNPEIIDGVRRIVTRRFPYAIAYEAGAGKVMVISVLHMSRERAR